MFHRRCNVYGQASPLCLSDGQLMKLHPNEGVIQKYIFYRIRRLEQDTRNFDFALG